MAAAAISNLDNYLRLSELIQILQYLKSHYTSDLYSFKYVTTFLYDFTSELLRIKNHTVSTVEPKLCISWRILVEFEKK
jgi:hypothetical protein